MKRLAGSVCVVVLALATSCSGGELDAPVSSSPGPQPAPSSTATTPAPAGCALPHATAMPTAAGCKLLACDAGFSDCDAQSANGCEVDLLTSAAHCGECEHACATCQRGACGVVSELADDLHPRELMARGDRVAWLDVGRLRVSDPVGLTATWSAGLSVVLQDHEAGALALGDGFAVVADVAAQKLWRIEPGARTSLADGAFTSVTLVGGAAYALIPRGDETGSLVRVPLDGGAPITLASGLDVSTPCRIAADAANVYFTDPVAEIVWRVPVSGGAPEPWATRQRMTCGVVLDDARAYWVSVDPTLAVFVTSVDKGETPDPDWIQTAVPVGHYLAGQFAWDLASDGAAVVFSNAHDGTVFRLDTVHGAPTLLAASQVPRGVAVGTRVSWGTPEGVVSLAP